MAGRMYPERDRDVVQHGRSLAPAQQEAFEAFSKAVFAEGALTEREKQLIAVAVAHTTQCPYCIKGHTKSALQKGATDEQVMEAIWVAAEMRAGGAYAHSTLALDVMQAVEVGDD
jgi:alkylhydroperoxidase/carboxymuconolactone decarboxylase family protein